MTTGSPPGGKYSSIEADFSTYTLRQLFEARYWVDPQNGSKRTYHLENEIHKRCAYIRERINRQALAHQSARFRPFGFILGVGVLACSIGPYVAAEGFDLINIMGDVDGDPLTLSGVWAVLTSPVAAAAFMIGGITDAGRIVEWFHLAGLNTEAPRPVWPNVGQIAGSAVAVLRRWLRTEEVRDLAN